MQWQFLRWQLDQCLCGEQLSWQSANSWEPGQGQSSGCPALVFLPITYSTDSSENVLLSVFSTEQWTLHFWPCHMLPSSFNCVQIKKLGLRCWSYRPIREARSHLVPVLFYHVSNFSSIAFSQYPAGCVCQGISLILLLTFEHLFLQVNRMQLKTVSTKTARESFVFLLHIVYFFGIMIVHNSSSQDSISFQIS